jgi:hypothetical protein
VLDRVRPEGSPEFSVSSLAEQVEVELAERRWEPIRIVPFVCRAVGEVEAEPVGDRKPSVREQATEQTTTCRGEDPGGSVRKDALDRPCIRAIDPEANPLGMGTSPEDPVGFRVLSQNQAQFLGIQHGHRSSRRQG